jgi:hypothetical protein
MEGTMRESPDLLLRRIRDEFVEMPGMSLTGRQAARLWHVDPVEAEDLLRLLVDTHFLSQHDGRYRRASAV